MAGQLTENEYAYQWKRLTTNPDRYIKNSALETAISELRGRLGLLQESDKYNEGSLGVETLYIDVAIAVLIQLIER